MSAQINQLENITGGILLACMISAERGAQRARDRREQADAIIAHNAGVARARARRRQAAALVAAQIQVGQSRMDRWLDRATR